MKYNVGRGESVGMKGYFHSNQWLFLLILISSILCLFASFILSRDALVLAANPGIGLNCDINDVIGCSKVAEAWQAQVLGFPNAYLGMMTEPVVVTIAVAGLANVKFPRWFMFTAQLVYLVALGFAWWLFTQSAFVIYSLCPYCLIITVFTSITFFTLLHYNIRENNLYLPARAQKLVEAATRYRITEFAAAFLVLLVLTIILALYGTAVFAF